MLEEEGKYSQFFDLPVDSASRATTLRPLSTAPPHMLAFHLSWLSLFSCFFSAFAPAPLLPVLRDALDLTSVDSARSAIASAVGIVIGRALMGPACDLVGPRLALAALTMVTAPPAFLLAAGAATPSAFLLLRFLSGLSLAAFVSTQFWMSSMFSPSVVGLANALSAGWANLGSSAAQLLMPVLYTCILRLGPLQFSAWRAALFIPVALQVGTALAVLLFGDDLPSNTPLSCKPDDRKKNFLEILKEGVCDYRGWVLGFTYGFCYGVELTMENVVAEYFYDKFGMGIAAAGAAAAGFGAANVVSRPGGGVVCDEMGRRFGMRGRLWGLWAAQSVGGLFCVLMGRMGTLEGAVAAMIGVSVFAQAAGGLTFGVVPFVSRRAMGVVSGITGSGGAVGTIIIQQLFFSGSKYSKETGISLMGIMILVCTLPVALIYFPKWEGMLCAPKVETNIDESDDDYQLLS